MRASLAFIIGVMLVFGALAGCDDKSGVRARVKPAHHASAASAAPPGVGWRDVAKDQGSAWQFMNAPEADAPAESAGPSTGGRTDALGAIRAALSADRLPPRDSVRIAELIEAVLSEAHKPDAELRGTQRSEAMVTTSPWNDRTWLLWVSVSGLDQARPPAIRIDFDSRTITSFRALGDVAALPDPRAAGGREGMLYELSSAPDGPQSPGVVYAVLHVGASDAAPGYDRPIGPADFVDSIDNAPDSVRFATAVAGFAQLLRGDPAVRDLSCADVIALAESADQPDPNGVRAETIDLMRRAEPLIDQPPGDAPAEGR